MRRSGVLLLAGILCASLTSTAAAQRYDRYERYGAPPPPRRSVPAPPPSHAVYGQPYVFGHIGLFEPNDNEPTRTGGGLGGYDAGGAFDIGLGSRVTPYLAIDGTFGGHRAERGGDEADVVPLTIGVRVILPASVLEPYLGGGAGLYFAHLEEPGINDSDTTFGGYGSLGVDAWLTPRTALNFEGKYHWAKPTFDGIDVDVSGWTVNIGVRVSF